jgi:hypothetical protein
MNWAWFDGKMSIEHYQHEHPLDTKALIEAIRTADDQDAEEESQEPAESVK